MTYQAGNLLGAARAEADEQMLEKAFVQTHDYHVLVSTRDFNFVVGRRGTGKTALFLKTSQFFEGSTGVFLCKVRPEEHEILALALSLENCAPNYRVARAITRVIWRAHLLMEVASRLRCHWKIKRSERVNKNETLAVRI